MASTVMKPLKARAAASFEVNRSSAPLTGSHLITAIWDDDDDDDFEAAVVAVVAEGDDTASSGLVEGDGEERAVADILPAPGADDDDDGDTF